MPPHIADLLALLHILLVYARHLPQTLEHRSVAWGYSVIAQFFGTARVELILARVARGILRIMALQRVLLNRARQGRDLVFLPPRTPTKRPPQPPQAAEPEPPASRPRPLRRRDTDEAPDPDHLPSLKQLEAEIRRHPIGWTVADICRDLGIAPSLCHGPFWNAVFAAITWYRGNLPRLMKDFRRRDIAFDPQMNPTPRCNYRRRAAAASVACWGFSSGSGGR